MLDTSHIQQGTDEWKALRLGKITASKIADVMSKGRGSAPSATRANYMAQLAAERLTGETADSFKNAAMDHGNETEPQARAMYSMNNGVIVEEVAFVLHPDLPYAGASPDGLVGDDGLLEIKCPNTATHIATLRGGSIKGGYLLQMQWQMSCTGRKWCDFQSFDPRMPEYIQSHVTRVPRDDARIAEIIEAVSLFETELAAMVAELGAMQ